MRAAAVQLNARADKAANLEKADRLVRRAAADGATLVVLPEKWTAIGTGDDLRVANLDNRTASTIPPPPRKANVTTWLMPAPSLVPPRRQPPLRMRCPVRRASTISRPLPEDSRPLERQRRLGC